MTTVRLVYVLCVRNFWRRISLRILDEDLPKNGACSRLEWGGDAESAPSFFMCEIISQILVTKQKNILTFIHHYFVGVRSFEERRSSSSVLLPKPLSNGCWQQIDRPLAWKKGTTSSIVHMQRKAHWQDFNAARASTSLFPKHRRLETSRGDVLT